MAKITEEMVADFVRMHTGGSSYRAIGGKYKVDPRTVKSWIENARKERDREYWETVSQRVDAGYLDEHYRMLLGMANSVSEAVASNPITSHADEAPQQFLDRAAVASLHRNSDLLKQRGHSLDDSDWTVHSDQRPSRQPIHRLAARLLDGLLSHEPKLQKELERWEDRWQEFKEARDQVQVEALNLIEQNDELDLETGRSLAPEISTDVLEVTLLGAKPGQLIIEPPNNGEAGLLFKKGSGELNRISVAVGQDPDEARTIVEWLGDQLSLEGRLGRVESVYERLTKCVTGIEEIVDRMTLRGRPEGHCEHCPSWQLPYG